MSIPHCFNVTQQYLAIKKTIEENERLILKVLGFIVCGVEYPHWFVVAMIEKLFSSYEEKLSKQIDKANILGTAKDQYQIQKKKLIDDKKRLIEKALAFANDRYAENYLFLSTLFLHLLFKLFVYLLT